jgi:hypothetical protein
MKLKHKFKNYANSWCGRRDLNPGSQAWKACVLNQLDDDRHSDTVVLETKKAIDATLTMLICYRDIATQKGGLRHL